MLLHVCLDSTESGLVETLQLFVVLCRPAEHIGHPQNQNVPPHSDTCIPCTAQIQTDMRVSHFSKSIYKFSTTLPNSVYFAKTNFMTHDACISAHRFSLQSANETSSRKRDLHLSFVTELLFGQLRSLSHVFPGSHPGKLRLLAGVPSKSTLRGQ